MTIGAIDAWLGDPATWPDMIRVYEAFLGAGYQPLTNAGLREQVIPRLREAFRRGDLVALELPLTGQKKAENRGHGVHGKPSLPEPPLPPPPPRRPAPAPKALHRFAIRFVDEVGGPLSGVGLSLVHGGTKERLSTDGNGVAQIEESPATSATAAVVDPKALRKALKPVWEGTRGERPWLNESQGVTVVPLLGKDVPSFDLPADKLRIVSIQPYVARVRLIGGFFDTSKCFVQPRGLDAIRAVVRMYREFPKAKLLCVGHTDPSGKPDYNGTLSLERAEAAVAYLTDDVEAWYAWYGSGKPEAKRWGSKEDAAMIAAMPDFGERDRAEETVRWYQRTRGLAVDGVAGPETRQGLIREYMEIDGTSLPRGIEAIAHGCGENFPAKATAGDESAEDDRRVEFFFFDGELGVQPSPPGKNSKPGSLAYPEWVKRTKQSQDHVIVAGQVWFRLKRLMDDKPAAGLVAVIAMPDGTTIRQKADDEGYIRLDGMTGEQFRLLETIDEERGHRVTNAEAPTPIPPS